MCCLNAIDTTARSIAAETTLERDVYFLALRDIPASLIPPL
jgi:hypothetical protein